VVVISRQYLSRRHIDEYRSQPLVVDMLICHAIETVRAKHVRWNKNSIVHG